MSVVKGYYRHPTISGDVVAFVAEDDLWCVSVAGGAAHRLTANPGAASFPAFSPDGAKIAYTSRDEGHPEAWVMEADGGSPRRLSFMGAITQVVGWCPDGSAVLVASDWMQPFQGFMHLHAIPLNGAPPHALCHGPARAIAYREGAGVVIGRNTHDPARWKRYRGGTAGTLWIDRKGDGNFRPLTELPGNLASPIWLGSRIYFISDHEGTGNLYSCRATGRDLVRHTHHEDFYARFASSDGRRIVYHAGADVCVYDPRGGNVQKLDLRLPSARPQRNRRFMAPGKFLERFDLHPQGHSIAVNARGSAFSMGLWEGAPQRYRAASGVRYRLSSWLADGRRLVTVSDESGEERLEVFETDGAASSKRLEADVGRAAVLAVAPAGLDRVAIVNHRHEVLLVDVALGRARVVHRSDYQSTVGLAWSQDGRWLAFDAQVSERARAIFLFDTDNELLQRITHDDFFDIGPCFDPEGRYLYFLSWRDFNPVHDAHYHDAGFPRGGRPYLIPLLRDAASPFASVSRLPRPPGAADKKRDDDDGDDEASTPPVVIDIEGIEDRVVAFPVEEGRYGRILGAHGRALFSVYPVEGSLGSGDDDEDEHEPEGRLQAYDFAKEEVVDVSEGISDFAVSMDGKVLAIQAGESVRVVPVAFKSGDDDDDEDEDDEPGRASGWLDLGRIRIEVVPGDEWRQMFREAWRLQRDQFWSEDMSGVDWAGVHDRYLPLLERVATRTEFSDLMWEMQGELGTSHAYEFAGDYRPAPGWFQGFLGADLILGQRSGRWRIARIPRGDAWDTHASSPLSRPGTGIAPGDELLAVDGRSVDRATSPFECLTDRAGRAVSITVRRGRRKPRRVALRALRDEYRLRYRDWVEHNRARVHDASEGRSGYLHIPDMGAQGFAEFHRYFRTEVAHEGLVVDVRFNRGGSVSDLLLEKLLRRRIGYDVSRWGQPISYPMDAPSGPMVALTNEYAGSDGDIFCHAFKLYGLGPLLGKRTWGGVIGIWPRHALVDGTVTTQPEFSFWFEDVGWQVENYGTDPDIEVDIKPQDYAGGIDPQLDRAAAEILKVMGRKRKASPEFDHRPSRKPPQLPPI